MKKILIYVQHLLGSGHFVRAYAIANALAHKGHNVHLVSGGFPVPNACKNSSENLQIFQLMPIRSLDEHFTTLVSTDKDGNATVIDANFIEARKQQLLDYIDSHNFDAAVIETYPFGRRQLRAEITHMLDALKEQRGDCKIYASIRDILQRREDKREQETIAVLKQYFDGVLIHADKSFAQLSDSFTRANEITIPIHYTGYVYQINPQGVSEDTHQETIIINETTRKKIVVSAGGSDQGFDLLHTVMLAAVKINKSEKNYHWHILYSPNLTVSEIEILQSLSNGNRVVCEPNRADYPEFIRSADLVISYTGYNSVMDIFNAKANALLIPFNKGNETEQTDRAFALKKSKRAYVYTHNNFEVDKMVTSIVSALNNKDHLKITAFNLPAMDGVEKTADIILQELCNFTLAKNTHGT